MALDEATAYALATWKRFEEEVSDDLLRAVCAAFALVAVADGQLESRELDQFLVTLRENFSPPQLDLDRLEQEFRDLAQALLSDPVGGRLRALSILARIKHHEGQRELVLAAARVALIADERIAPGEVSALNEIRRALEIEPIPPQPGSDA